MPNPAAACPGMRHPGLTTPVTGSLAIGTTGTGSLNIRTGGIRSLGTGAPGVRSPGPQPGAQGAGYRAPAAAEMQLGGLVTPGLGMRGVATRSQLW